MPDLPNCILRFLTKFLANKLGLKIKESLVDASKISLWNLGLYWIMLQARSYYDLYVKDMVVVLKLISGRTFQMDFFWTEWISLEQLTGEVDLYKAWCHHCKETIMLCCLMLREYFYLPHKGLNGWFFNSSFICTGDRSGTHNDKQIWAKRLDCWKG